MASNNPFLTSTLQQYAEVQSPWMGNNPFLNRTIRTPKKSDNETNHVALAPLVMELRENELKHWPGQSPTSASVLFGSNRPAEIAAMIRSNGTYNGEINGETIDTIEDAVPEYMKKKGKIIRNGLPLVFEPEFFKFEDDEDESSTTEDHELNETYLMDEPSLNSPTKVALPQAYKQFIDSPEPKWNVFFKPGDLYKKKRSKTKNRK